MRKLSACISAAIAIPAALALGTACTTSAGASLHVINDSDYVIVELYLTDVGSGQWGPNLLGNNPLRVGEDLFIDVQCGNYDALLVDEKNVDCELHGLDLCLNNAQWVIRNNTCAVFGARKAPGDAAETLKDAAATAAPPPSIAL
jgi:hypothetical protein